MKKIIFTMLLGLQCYAFAGDLKQDPVIENMQKKFILAKLPDTQFLTGYLNWRCKERSALQDDYTTAIAENFFTFSVGEQISDIPQLKNLAKSYFKTFMITKVGLTSYTNDASGRPRALVVRAIKNSTLIIELSIKSLSSYIDGYYALMAPTSKLGADWRLVSYISCEPILR